MNRGTAPHPKIRAISRTNGITNTLTIHMNGFQRLSPVAKKRIAVVILLFSLGVVALSAAYPMMVDAGGGSLSGY
jgi:hypothetical protein